MLKTSLEGNLTLERVQRNQSGTYGCRVEDYDAPEDADLSKTLDLRVACERLRSGRGALASAISSPSPPPRSPVSNPFCGAQPGLNGPGPSSLPCKAARDPFLRHTPDLPLPRTCCSSPVLWG